MVFFFVLLFAILISVKIASSVCPCDDAPLESNHYNTQRIFNFTTNPLVLCILNAKSTIRTNLELLQLDDINIHFINSNEYQPRYCNVLLNVTNEVVTNVFSNQRRLCPGTCRLVYVRALPLEFLRHERIGYRL